MASIAAALTGSATSKSGRPIERLIGSFMALTLATHGVLGPYLESCELGIKAKAEADGLPDWVGAQAEKNLWKALILMLLGVPLSAFVMWSSSQGLLGGVWLQGLLAFNLAFQV